MRPTCARRLGRDGVVVGGGPEGGGGEVCAGSGIGACMSLDASTGASGDWGRDEQGERSISVRSATDCGAGKLKVSCAAVSTVSLLRGAAVASVCRKTFGE
jgi:hypothetical protein